MRTLLAQLLMLLSTTVSAETLRVKVIDTKTARPVEGLEVQIAFNGGPEYEPYKPVPNSSKIAVTDSDGNASFFIRPQPKQHIIIAFSGRCATERTSFNLQEILASGVVVDNHCYHPTTKFKNVKGTPGEILMFRDQLNFFERLAHWRDAQ
jgi:hypothetical protein